MKQCKYCLCEFYSEDSSALVCSGSCNSVGEFDDGLEKSLKTTQPSEDARIFFYPLSFGRLIDEYVTLSLKRSHAKSIRVQQELDYIIFKCKKSIETHLSQIAYEKKHRDSFYRLSSSLFVVCSKMFRLKNLARDSRTSEDQKRDCALETFQLSDQRHKIIYELDFLLNGKSNHFRIQPGKDS